MLDIVMLLLKHGADIEAKDNLGRTPLWIASKQRNKAVVTLLLEQGAQVDAKNNLGQTPLWIASEMKYWDVFMLLSEQGADIMTKDDSGQGLEWIAVRRGDEVVIERLATKENAEAEVVDGQ
jgi:ankyrin repeat protein